MKSNLWMKECFDDPYLTPLLYSAALDMENWDKTEVFFDSSVFCVEGFVHYGDHSVPAWCNLITVDLGIPRQCPRRAVLNASREHPVLGDRNIRRDRWLINHGGACTVSMGGLPLENTLRAGGQREHQLSNTSPGRGTTLTGWLPGVTEAESKAKTWRTASAVLHCSLAVGLCVNILRCDFTVCESLFLFWLHPIGWIRILAWGESFLQSVSRTVGVHHMAELSPDRLKPVVVD